MFNCPNLNHEWDTRHPQQRFFAITNLQVEDICYLIECLEESKLPIQWRELPSIIALQLVWQRHYQVITDETTGFKQVHWKPKRELARAGEGIESPYDIEARYRSRYGVCSSRIHGTSE